ncbi:MAG: UDP-N-acetyl-D-mannosamine dehydrogenase [Phycisphaerae bacterium]|nr:UDP-N-acetyl-D-mannosamine dehydrogenase [Phycisphaerae bacterium]
MAKPRVGVVGGGVVGSAMLNLCGPETVVYDPAKPEFAGNKGKINTCDVVFVSVPTPMRDDRKCDTSIVEEVISWVEAPLIIIRSTVAPGTTDRLSKKYGRNIVFQPEYLGETVAHMFGNMAERQFVVLGGTPAARSQAADFYKHYYNSMVYIYMTDALTAEVCKYMENAFYAVKVTFVNEFYDVAQAFGVDFNELRECWLADTRISRDHTFVYPDNRGFGGKCLPKDCNAIVQACQERGYEPKLMQAMLKVNDEMVKKSKAVFRSQQR